MKKKTWIQIMMAVFIMLVGVLYSSSNCYAADERKCVRICERSAGTCGRRYSHGYCLYGW